MLVVKIGDITLTSPLWWTDYNVPSPIIAEAQNTIDGGVIVYEMLAKDDYININLNSMDDGWQTKAVKDSLVTLLNNSLGLTTTITTIEDDIIAVRFRHENNPMAFTRVVDAYESIYYNVEINLAKIREV